MVPALGWGVHHGHGDGWKKKARARQGCIAFAPFFAFLIRTICFFLFLVPECRRLVLHCWLLAALAATTKEPLSAELASDSSSSLSSFRDLISSLLGRVKGEEVGTYLSRNRERVRYEVEEAGRGSEEAWGGSEEVWGGSEEVWGGSEEVWGGSEEVVRR